MTPTAPVAEPEPAQPVARLVTVAHGTRHAPGNDVARELTLLAGDLLQIPAEVAYVELCDPLLTDVMRELEDPSVVVPLLLSTGFHIRHDLPEAAALSAVPVTMAPPLGPDPLIARVQVAQLQRAGAQPGQAVVMVAAGSMDSAAVTDLETARDHLTDLWGAEVRLAAYAGELPRPGEIIRPGDAVSLYLLAEGHFAARTRDEGAAAAVISPVLGPHPLLAELIAQRAEQATGTPLRVASEAR